METVILIIVALVIAVFMFNGFSIKVPKQINLKVTHVYKKKKKKKISKSIVSTNSEEGPKFD